MRTLQLVIEYDGGRYAGWQRQPDVPSIQAALEEAAARLLQTPHRVVGAGRTDAGVHALGQVAHLTTESGLAAERIRDGLNALLPPDIVVREVCEAAATFHARRDARLRIYRYAVLARPRPSALLRGYAHHVPGPLDLEAMRAAAAHLEGRHDFAAFRVSGTATASTICSLAAVTIERRGDLILFTVAANRFLRQMARRMVGTLLQIGRGALAPDAIPAILGSRDTQRAGPPAPAHGLYLMRIVYDPAADRPRGGEGPVML
ncbi:MAG: tRNA pseudouridine(38-40) synthase TruA [Armatimonadetes bacterium]|nr:tRNA pseudouridine(38-40) synthase TruA [Armatimonadota bacterium]